MNLYGRKQLKTTPNLRTDACYVQCIETRTASNLSEMNPQLVFSFPTPVNGWKIHLATKGIYRARSFIHLTHALSMYNTRNLEKYQDLHRTLRGKLHPDPNMTLPFLFRFLFRRNEGREQARKGETDTISYGCVIVVTRAVKQQEQTRETRKGEIGIEGLVASSRGHAKLSHCKAEWRTMRLPG